MESYSRLTAEYELVLVEGAGSPAEVNLRERDIANMGFALGADVPVCLLADIERGGVIASIVGTREVIAAEDAELVCGYIVNKFRGDPGLFDAGLDCISERTGWPNFGVIPWLACLAALPEEDAVPDSAGERTGGIKIAAPMLSRMANFDDADPLRLEDDVDFRFVPPGDPIPRDADLVILFGTKSTRADLQFVREQGWHHDIYAHARAGGRVLGICGGYQLLGSAICDAEGLDGEAGESDALGLLDVTTRMGGHKTVAPVNGRCAITDIPIRGYEIHVGETHGIDCQRPVVTIDGRADGATSADGNVSGTYVHGLLANDAYRSQFLAPFRGEVLRRSDYSATVQNALNELADALEASLDIDGLLAAARRPR